VDEDGTSRTPPALGIRSGPVVSADSCCRNCDGSCRWRFRRGHPLTERLRHTQGMAPQASSSDRFSVVELTVHSARSDRLEVDPLDLGPDAPAPAALEVERGPEPRDVRQRGE
jgi:hypothetical protein